MNSFASTSTRPRNNRPAFEAPLASDMAPLLHAPSLDAISTSTTDSLPKLPFPLNRLRSRLAKWIAQGNEHVASFQRLMGVDALSDERGKELQQTDKEDEKKENRASVAFSKKNALVNGLHDDSRERERESSDPIIKNTYEFNVRLPAIRTYFSIAAAAGNETFYIICLPLTLWLIDPVLTRRIMLMWVLTYYVGQVCKDSFQLPRPSSPLIAKLEEHYETEFGFPSTHAMVSVTLPAAVIQYFCQVKGTCRADQWFFGIFISALWCASITCSRLYNGVHSPVDVLGGLTLGSIIAFVVYFLQDAFHHWLQHPGLFTAPTLVLIVFFMLAVYPRPARRWTNCAGDTSVIVGASLGVFIAVATLPEVRHWQALSASFHPSEASFWYYAALRAVLGGCTMAVVKVSVKKLTMTILPLLLLDEKQRSSERMGRVYLIEVPAKLINYSAVSFCAIILGPFMFDRLHI